MSNPSDLPTDPEESGGPIGIAGLRPLKGVRRSLYATFAGRTLQPNGRLCTRWVVGAHLPCLFPCKHKYPMTLSYVRLMAGLWHDVVSKKKPLETYCNGARSAASKLPRPAAFHFPFPALQSSAFPNLYHPNPPSSAATIPPPPSPSPPF